MQKKPDNKAPEKVEIPGFPKAMAGVQVFKPEKIDVSVDSVDIAGKFDLANLAKEMMDRNVFLYFLSNYFRYILCGNVSL